MLFLIVLVIIQLDPKRRNGDCFMRREGMEFILIFFQIKKNNNISQQNNLNFSIKFTSAAPIGPSTQTNGSGRKKTSGIQQQ